MGFYTGRLKSRRRAALHCFLCFTFLLCILGCATTGGLGRDSLTQVEGIEYIYRWEEEKPWSIHIVKIERAGKDFEFVSTLARDSIIGLSTLREQIAGLKVQDCRPVAAVNGDFFRIQVGLYQGDPLGLQIMEGELISSPRGASFWIDAQGKPRIGAVKSKFNAVLPNGEEAAFEINQERLDGAAVLYTSLMGPSTRTTGGMELILEAAESGVKAGGSFKAKVLEISSIGNSVIKEGQVILSIGPELIAKAGQVNVGAMISISLKTEPDMTGVRTAIGGGPVLVQKGKPVDLTGNPVRHPRTVLGWNDDYYILAVVDGRQKGLSIGMSMQELSTLMLSLGCSEAINLDGGGSSTFWLNGKVLNSPSDGRERRVANGLVVMQKKKAKEE